MNEIQEIQLLFSFKHFYISYVLYVCEQALYRKWTLKPFSKILLCNWHKAASICASGEDIHSFKLRACQLMPCMHLSLRLIVHTLKCSFSSDPAALCLLCRCKGLLLRLCLFLLVWQIYSQKLCSADEPAHNWWIHASPPPMGQSVCHTWTDSFQWPAITVSMYKISRI
jgi:hypothetical protein